MKIHSSKLVPFSTEVESGTLKVLTDGNHVYHQETLICLDGGFYANDLLEVLRQPTKYPELYAKMVAYDFELIDNTYVFHGNPEKPEEYLW